MKFKRIFTNWKVILLLVFVAFSLVSIFSLTPALFSEKGVTIRGVDLNSSALDAGIQNPTGKMQPLAREQVLALNGKSVHSVEEYHLIESQLMLNRSVQVQTTKQVYNVVTVANEEAKPSLGLRVS